MAHVETSTFNNPDITPTTYCRYVDDAFLEVRDQAHLSQIIRELEHNSVLKFTFEKHHNNQLAFLDVNVQATPDRYLTSVYVKPTSQGQTLNAKSECPSRYKQSVLRAFVTRAIKTTSTHELMDAELNRIRQLLVNNGYSNSEIDQEINKQLTKQQQKQQAQTETPASQEGDVHTLYYKNYMSTEHKTDEKILKGIIKKNVRCTKSTDRVQLRIYYQSQKTRQLVMRNNPVTTKPSNRTNVVYKFCCPHEDCRPRNVYYIGATTTTLARRLTMHLRDESGPVDHYITTHQHKPTHKTLKENTQTLDTINDHYRLFIQEAIYIARLRPALNTQMNTHISLALWGLWGMWRRSCVYELRCQLYVYIVCRDWKHVNVSTKYCDLLKRENMLLTVTFYIIISYFSKCVTMKIANDGPHCLAFCSTLYHLCCKYALSWRWLVLKYNRNVDPNDNFEVFTSIFMHEHQRNTDDSPRRSETNVQ